MLQRDYILQLIKDFTSVVTGNLRAALEDGDLSSAKEVEDAVAELLGLDTETALRLTPTSLVTMMELSGTSDIQAAYVAYALNRLADAYERCGKKKKGELRREQARAIAVAFGWNLSVIPDEFQQLEDMLGE